MHPDPHAIHIYVDGSCQMHNGRRSGFAGLVIFPDDPIPHEIFFEGFQESTNNRMEISAIIAALEWLREYKPRETRAQIFSDSTFAVNGIRRAPYAKRAKWRSAAGRPLENSDLFDKAIKARANAGIRADIELVKGKASPLSKHIDKLAKRAAGMPVSVDRGYIKGKIGRAKTKGGHAEMFPAVGQQVTIRVYASRNVGRTRENHIRFEIYDEATRQYGAKYFAYADPEIGSELHRGHGYSVQMNGTAKYPKILAILRGIELPNAGKKLAAPAQPHHRGVGETR